MGTTQKWSKILLAAMVLLAFGLVAVGCEGGIKPGKDGIKHDGGGAYDGTYINARGNQKYVLSGSNFVISVYSPVWKETFKGTFTVSGTTITFSTTHAATPPGNPLEPLDCIGIEHAAISQDGRTITDADYSHTKQ